jgi:hypothetical protein
MEMLDMPLMTVDPWDDESIADASTTIEICVIMICIVMM